MEAISHKELLSILGLTQEMTRKIFYKNRILREINLTYKNNLNQALWVQTQDRTQRKIPNQTYQNIE